MLEKIYIISKDGVDSILTEISEIIHNEVESFIATTGDKDTKESIFEHLQKELTEWDFVDISYTIAGCTVAYNIAKTYGNRITLSSAFDIPNSKQIETDAFDISVRLDELDICLDTSKAASTIQFFMSLVDIAKSTGLPRDENTKCLKPQIVYQKMEDMGFKLVEDSVWTRTLNTEDGKMEIVTKTKESIQNICQEDMDSLEVLVTLAE